MVMGEVATNTVVHGSKIRWLEYIVLTLPSWLAEWSVGFVLVSLKSLELMDPYREFPSKFLFTDSLIE